MSAALRIAGTLLLLVGAVWIAQGLGWLPGSFMTGQREWAMYGALAAALGALLWWLARRRTRR
jgi:hypothetical protein